MIKSLNNTLKMDKEKYKVPRSVQECIPIRRIWKDGIFRWATSSQSAFGSRISIMP